MAENTYIELKDNINTEYIFVKNIKNTASMLINVLESRVTGKRILVKYYDGNIDVYQKLLGKTLPNIPTVYNAVCEDGKCIVVEDYIDGITIGEMLEVGRYSSKEVEKIILELCDARSARLFLSLDSSIRPIWR